MNLNTSQNKVPNFPKNVKTPRKTQSLCIESSNKKKLIRLKKNEKMKSNIRKEPKTLENQIQDKWELSIFVKLFLNKFFWFKAFKNAKNYTWSTFKTYLKFMFKNSGIDKNLKEYKLLIVFGIVPNLGNIMFIFFYFLRNFNLFH
jgi:hypothetical protein